MKILVNLITLERRGVSLGWLSKWRRLSRLGVDLYFNGPGFVKKITSAALDNVYSFNENFAEISQLPALSSKFAFIFYAFKKNLLGIGQIPSIRKENFDFIYSPAGSLDLTFLPWLIKMRDKKIKWLVSFDNLVPLSDPGNKIIRFLAWLFFQISLLFIKKADIIFVTTPESVPFLLRHKISFTKIVMTGYAIEGDLIRAAVPEPGRSFDALFIGRLNKTKGIDDLLKILAYIKQKYPDFQLAIMGRGDAAEEEYFQRNITVMKLKNNITLLGYVTGQKKFNLIKSSKVFIFPSKSKSESFGMALLEAVCSGLPAFAYDLAPYQNIYRQGEVHICPIGDWQCLAEKILAVFTRGDFHNRAGLLLLDKYASWDKIADLEFAAIKKLSG